MEDDAPSLDADSAHRTDLCPLLGDHTVHRRHDDQKSDRDKDDREGDRKLIVLSKLILFGIQMLMVLVLILVEEELEVLPMLLLE